MAQFDVYANPGRRTREAMPFLVDIQSSLYRSHSTRLVVPLIRASLLRTRDSLIHLEFEVGGIAVLLNPLDITPVPVSTLAAPVDSLAARGSEIITAIDWLLSRAFD